MLESIAECVLQVVAESFVPLIPTLVRAPWAARPGPWVAVVGAMVHGAAAGLVSLALLDACLTATWARVVHLLVTPVFVGAGLGVVGRRWRRRSARVPAILGFGPAYAFALTFAAVRLLAR